MKKIATIGGLLAACGAANAQLNTTHFGFSLFDNAGGSGAITPTEIFVTGGNIGVMGETKWMGVAPATGTLSFDWAYLSSDSGCFDTGFMSLNGSVFTLACNTSAPTGGFVQISANAGDIFCFGVWSADGIFGPGTLEVSNFIFKKIPAPGSLALIGAAGLLAVRRRR